MGTYLITLITASLVAAVVGILTPDGERGGIAKHMQLLISLALLCMMIAPVKDAIAALTELAGGEWVAPELGATQEEDYREKMEEAMQNASGSYLAELLTDALEREFSIASGEVRCAIRWQATDGAVQPSRVTVILSGRAIWVDPAPIERYVSDLLGCECVSAIE